MTGSWISKDIDLKIAAQIQQQLRVTAQNKAPFVTVSREYGCDGKDLAQAIIAALSQYDGQPWKLFHRDMLKGADKEGTVTDEQLNLLEGFGHSDLQSYFLEAVFGMPNQIETIKNIGRLYQILAQKGHMVFLGGGATIFTRNLDTGMHIRLFAETEWRVKNHAQRWNLDETQARTRVMDRHRRREAFITTFLGENFRDTNHYHMLINNEKVPLATAAELVVTYLRSR